MSMIEKLEKFIKIAQEDELEKEMRPEAVSSLKAAVESVGFNYTSLEECLMGAEVYEEAEALYFEEDDEFPLKYIAALKGVALLAEESEVGGMDLPDLPGPLPMEEEAKGKSERKTRIEKEVKEFIKQAEEQELDKEMRQEGIQALHVAVEQLAYKMKAFDDEKNKHVAFPSVAAILVGQDIYEIAEKHYYDPEDEYPLKYISALREVAMIAGGYDEDVDEMESRGQGIDSDDEIFCPPKTGKTGNKQTSFRKVKVEKEVRQYIKQAEDQELDKEMREEGVNAVITAANTMAYKKKWYDEEKRTWVAFPSIKAIFVRNEIYEEAEKYYYDPGDAFPLKYVSALKEMAMLDGGYDEDIDAMEEDGRDVDSDDELLSSKVKIRSVRERMSVFEVPRTPSKNRAGSVSPLVGSRSKKYSDRAFNQRMSMYTTRGDEKEMQKKKLLELKILNRKGADNVEKGMVGKVSGQFNDQLKEKLQVFKADIQEILNRRNRLRNQKQQIRTNKKYDPKVAEVEVQTQSLKRKKQLISGAAEKVWSNVRATKIDIDHKTYQDPMNLPEPTQQEETLISDAMKDSVLFHPHRDMGDTKQALVHAFEKVDVTEGEEMKEGLADNFFYVVKEGSVDIKVNGEVIGSANEGEHFGELNLLYANDPSQPRQKFNIVANKNSTLMRLNQAVFREVLQVQTKREEDVKKAYLKKAPFLRNLLFDGEVEKNKQTTTRLTSIMTEVKFKKGEKILAEDAKAEDSLFIIKEGKVQLTSDKNDVFHLAAGSYIGKRALMASKGKEPNVKDLEGLTDGSLFQIDKQAVNKVMGENFISRLYDVAQDKKKLEGFQCIKSVNLNPAIMDQIAQNIEDKTFEGGKQILEEGADTEPCLYLVREGFVILSTNKGEFKQKVGPGGYFGVEQLLVPKDKSKPTQATEKVLVPAQWSVMVTGDTPCICGVLPLQDVQDVLDAEGDLGNLFDSKGIDLVLQPDKEDEKEAGKAEGKDANKDEDRKTPPPRLTKVKSAADTPIGQKIVKDRLRQREIVKKEVPALDNLEMLSVLGDGEFGEVWLVKAADYNFALKMQNKESADVIKAIQSEITITKGLIHPHLVDLVTTYDTKESVYMLLGLVPGGELWEQIYQEDDEGNWNSGLLETSAQFYGLVVADTLAWLHSKHFLYRDLKPENVMIDGDGYPILVDFGFAKKFEEGLTFTFCGTPNYVAPEIVHNQGHDAGVDYWALGVLIYEMLSGEHPFFDEGMHNMQVFEAICQNKHYKLQAEVSEAAIELIDGLLEKDRNDRLGMLAGKSDDIVRHDWFKEIDLLKLRSREVTAPWIPEKK